MTATATAEPLTASDLETIISTTEKSLDKLTSEQRELSLRVVRKQPGAAEELAAVERKLATTREAHRIASNAIIELGAEEARAAEIAAEADRAQLEAAYAKAKAVADETLRDFGHLLDNLVSGVRAALVAGDEVYRLALARGINGNPLGTRNAIESRIGHVLNLEAGLKQFDLARGTGREPLVGGSQNLPTVPQATPLPDRRDTHEAAGYPGQNVASKPIIKTELKDPAGAWIEVPIGSVDFPTEAVEAVLDDDLASLRADAERRSAKRKSKRSAA